MKLRNIISAVAAAAVAASAASLCAFADDQPAGYVYFMAEKTTLGQGFEVEPVKVPYYEGETGLDIVERAAEHPGMMPEQDRGHRLRSVHHRLR